MPLTAIFVLLKHSNHADVIPGEYKSRAVNIQGNTVYIYCRSYTAFTLGKTWHGMASVKCRAMLSASIHTATKRGPKRAHNCRIGVPVGVINCYNEKCSRLNVDVIGNERDNLPLI